MMVQAYPNHIGRTLFQLTSTDRVFLSWKSVVCWKHFCLIDPDRMVLTNFPAIKTNECQWDNGCWTIIPQYRNSLCVLFLCFAANHQTMVQCWEEVKHYIRSSTATKFTTTCTNPYEPCLGWDDISMVPAPHITGHFKDNIPSQSLGEWKDGWLEFNGILSTAAASCLRGLASHRADIDKTKPDHNQEPHKNLNNAWKLQTDAQTKQNDTKARINGILCCLARQQIGPFYISPGPKRAARGQGEKWSSTRKVSLNWKEHGNCRSSWNTQSSHWRKTGHRSFTSSDAVPCPQRSANLCPNSNHSFSTNTRKPFYTQ